LTELLGKFGASNFLGKNLGKFNDFLGKFQKKTSGTTETKGLDGES
jgi:hypothetical protein